MRCSMIHHFKRSRGIRWRPRASRRSELDLRGGTPRKEHLATFNDVDIALDPFPQNGGVSTWEALWMGVPVVAKLGNSLQSRLSGAIISGIGLNDWVTENDEQYIRLAVERAADIEALASLRNNLRGIVVASAAGNPQAYTRAVEAAYKTMWRRWCNRASERQ